MMCISRIVSLLFIGFLSHLLSFSSSFFLFPVLLQTLAASFSEPELSPIIMPPRKKSTATSTPAPTPPLDGCNVALCGSFAHLPQATLKQKIQNMGATALNAVSPDTTHLVTSPENYRKPTAKVKAAQSLAIPVVGVQWLLDCLVANTRQPESPHLLSRPTAVASVAAPPATPANTTRTAPSPPNGAIATKKRKQTLSGSLDGTTSPVTSQSDMKRVKKMTALTPSLPKTKIVVPVDEFCPLSNVVVHVDDDNVVWDASLNQTNSGNNNNKFYRIQVLRQPDGRYQTWTRWGRVGEGGQSAGLGVTSLDVALKQFNKKFKDKSGLSWENRGSDPRPMKYAYVERSYLSDSEDGADVEVADLDAASGPAGDEPAPPTCTLPLPVQNLMELIFNKQYFAATMSDLNYDANKLPLGKLSKSTISRGFQALKDLSALIDDPSLAQPTYNLGYASAVERLSNLYYSVIPHAFGRNRPPIIGDYIRLRKEVDLLESLSDMKDAELLMKVDLAKSDAIHPTDKHYRGLRMKEVTPIDRGSVEFEELAKYLDVTRGETHGVAYEIDDIFRIEREGERDRFDGCVLPCSGIDTRLLWHGSRVTNFGGILGQGLRIAPPEAPVSGYMFGKGIYLADMSSKSANYCCSDISDGTALLLLCEAKLGSPFQELTNSSYSAGEDAKEKGMFATLGQGKTAPTSWKDASCVHAGLSGVKMVSSSRRNYTNPPLADC